MAQSRVSFSRICIIPMLAGAAALLLAVLAAPMPAHADIYMYQDEEGIMHMTNVPDSNKYKLFMREPRPKSKRGSGSSSGDVRLYDGMISEAAKLYELEVSLIKAVMKVESNFNPNAVSVKGAKGLMQIMPQNYDSLDIRNPFDPHENIMGGVKYLKQLLERYEGRKHLALAAYNCGPDTVDRYRTIPPIDETEQYVKKVLEYYKVYKAKGIST
ncbi:MAG: transglycosylase SLT domain-containing protein [Deltaproteobacteria bacterium]|nr:transglycosylase SLT domain-containing protein [Deltaproteobacteria bacterium]